jgi:hypothetical protein
MRQLRAFIRKAQKARVHHQFCKQIQLKIPSCSKLEIFLVQAVSARNFASFGKSFKKMKSSQIRTGKTKRFYFSLQKGISPFLKVY